MEAYSEKIIDIAFEEGVNIFVTVGQGYKKIVKANEKAQWHLGSS